MGDRPEGRSGPPRAAAWAALLVALIALVPRLLTALDDVSALDENVWRQRSDDFADAVLSADLGDATASRGDTATMPGVTTMWIGAAARGAWAAGHDAGFWADDASSFTTADSGLDMAQALVAVVCAALIGLLVCLVARWLGLVAAVVAGVLVATEPFLVAHGAVLHTDELLALLGVCAVVAAALVLGLPRTTSWAGSPKLAVLSGALWAGSFLTKVSALVYLVGIGLLGLWATLGALRRRADATRWQATSTLRRMLAWWSATAVGVFVVAYPALWVDPWDELQLMRRSSQLASEAQWQFFLGEPTERPSVIFYLVALPLRATPWLLVAGVVAALVLGLRAGSRRLAVALACMAGPWLVVLSLASKKFDRYGLMLLVITALTIGAATPIVADAVRRRFNAPPRIWRGVAIGGGALVLLHAVSVAPWGLAYFNPLLGGSDVAEDAVVVGWGEGADKTSDIVERHRHGDCDGVTVSGYLAVGRLGCGQLVADPASADYVAIYVAERQRMTEEQRDDLVQGRELVGSRRIRGITYVEVFGPPRVGVAEVAVSFW